MRRVIASVFAAVVLSGCVVAHRRIHGGARVAGADLRANR